MACLTSTSITAPFSACIIINAPSSAPRWNAFRICPSSERNTPLYAMNNLKLVTPSVMSSSIALSEESCTSDRIWWNP